MEAAPYQYAPQMQEKTRPFGYKPTYGQVTEDPGLTPDRMIGMPQQASADDMMQQFRDTVLNPPQRQHMTYPKSTLGALDAALQVYNTPTDYEKNRVYVDGNAYQRASTYKDPVTGEQKFITKYKQPSFMDQVMKAVPAGLPGAIDVMNQPQLDAEADWKMKTEGLQKGIQAESNLALSQQRSAQAAAIPINAETKRRLSELKDLPDSVKQQMVNDNRITVAEMQISGAMKRAELGTASAMDLQILRGIQGMEVQGLRGGQALQQIDRRGQNQQLITALQGQNQLANTAAVGQNQLTQIGAREQAQARLQQSQGVITAQQIAQRGELAQRLQEQRAKDALVQKAAPGWSAVNQSNSQQKIALQDRAMEVANATPGISEYITFNDQGFPVVDANNELDPETQGDIYESIYGQSSTALPQSGQRGDINLPNPPQSPGAPTGASRPIAAPAGAPAPIQAPNAPAIPPAAGGISGGQGAIPMIAPDGRSVRMIKPADVAIAESQGYTRK
jgi:hypothetical protein